MAESDYRRLGAACHCGEPPKAWSGRGRPPKYCGPPCAKQAMRAQQSAFARAAYVAKPIRLVACRDCGASVATRAAGFKRCEQCRKRRANELRRRPKDAAMCAAEGCKEAVNRKIAGARYCSNKCRINEGNRRQFGRVAAAKLAEAPRRCAWCSSEFKRSYGDRRQRYCSSECKASRDNAAKSGNTHRRRAKRFGVPYEHVNRLRVFARDGWRCQLCQRKVALSEAELDHIIPLSKGGPHTYANTQCACRRCNQLKSDRPLGQMLFAF